MGEPLQSVDEGNAEKLHTYYKDAQSRYVDDPSPEMANEIADEMSRKLDVLSDAGLDGAPFATYYDDFLVNSGLSDEGASFEPQTLGDAAPPNMPGLPLDVGPEQYDVTTPLRPGQEPEPEVESEPEADIDMETIRASIAEDDANAGMPTDGVAEAAAAAAKREAMRGRAAGNVEQAGNVALRMANSATGGALEGRMAALRTGNPLTMMTEFDPTAAWLMPQQMKDDITSRSPIGTGSTGMAPDQVGMTAMLGPFASLLGPALGLAQGPGIGADMTPSQQQMHQDLEAKVEEARAATEFGPEIPQSVPLLGGMSVGGMAMDMMAGVPLAKGMGGAERIMARSGETAIATGAKRAGQTIIESMPFGAAYGMDIPADDPLERTINMLGSAGVAGLLGPSVYVAGRVMGLAPYMWVRTVRRLKADDAGTPGFGGDLRRLEKARFESGEMGADIAATSVRTGYKPRPTKKIAEAQKMATEGEAFSAREATRSLLGGGIDEIAVQRTKMRADLDDASKAAVKEFAEAQRQGKNDFEVFTSRVATGFQKSVEKMRTAISKEERSHLTASVEADQKVSAAPMVKRLKEMSREGQSDGSANIFTSAPEYDSLVKKSMTMDVFEDATGEQAQRIRLMHGDESTDIVSYKEAVKLAGGEKNLPPLPKDVDAADAFVAVRPKAHTPMELGTVVKAVNKLLDADKKKTLSPDANLLELRAIMYKMRDRFPQYSKMKKRHEAQATEFNEAMEGLGVVGYDVLDDIAPIKNVRASLKTALVETAETPERLAAEKAMDLAGMKREIVEMQGARKREVDMESLGLDASSLGKTRAAESKLFNQMLSGDILGHDAAGMLPGGPGSARVQMRGAQAGAERALSIADGLGISPGKYNVEASDEQLVKLFLDAAEQHDVNKAKGAAIDELLKDKPTLLAKVKEYMPALGAYFRMLDGPDAIKGTVGETSRAYLGVTGRKVGMMGDPYARMMVGVDPSMRMGATPGTPGARDAAYVGAQAATDPTIATIQEETDKTMAMLKAVYDYIQERE